jgi:hypothetical protein
VQYKCQRFFFLQEKIISYSLNKFFFSKNTVVFSYPRRRRSFSGYLLNFARFSDNFPVEIPRPQAIGSVMYLIGTKAREGKRKISGVQFLTKRTGRASHHTPGGFPGKEESQ